MSVHLRRSWAFFGDTSASEREQELQVGYVEDQNVCPLTLESHWAIYLLNRLAGQVSMGVIIAGE